MSGLPRAEIHRDAPISLCSQLFLESVPRSEKLLIPRLLQQRAGKGHSNVFAQIYACLDPRATNHAYRGMMAEESKCTIQYRMHAHEDTTKT